MNRQDSLVTRAHPWPCKCDTCREIGNAYQRRVYRLTAYGRWQPYVDAAPVREHVRSLQAAGLGFRRVAALAGVTPRIVSYLLWGDPRRGKPPAKRIRTEAGRALLAVQAGPQQVAPNTLVDATGTRRRLQALLFLGWSEPVLAARLGAEVSTVNRITKGQARVAAATARKVAALYDQMWDQQPPQDTKGQRISAAMARARAARNGWPPPLAWDEDEIDDPAASPHPWKRGRLRDCAETAEDAAELLARGYTRDQVGERLGMKRTTLDHALNRAAASRQGRRAAA